CAREGQLAEGYGLDSW
nr:immunoglobulin heavy chain junction region [Macaca mulatta]MOY21246.1 immunoglobulin heavy chain junction region [Macaca mulatta]MOY21479.1 immunoglobulin heavy chain junction region [Macaca mulatta]MOY21498.1 immunoglobulin heavy chain junction region [Macaca mulatta]MOY21830.1 immunoglobulin heavy chain junction region [Macaca mulatta]